MRKPANMAINPLLIRQLDIRDKYLRDEIESADDSEIAAAWEDAANLPSESALPGWSPEASLWFKTEVDRHGPLGPQASDDYRRICEVNRFAAVCLALWVFIDLGLTFASDIQGHEAVGRPMPYLGHLVGFLSAMGLYESRRKGYWFAGIYALVNALSLGYAGATNDQALILALPYAAIAVLSCSRLFVDPFAAPSSPPKSFDNVPLKAQAAAQSSSPTADASAVVDLEQVPEGRVDAAQTAEDIFDQHSTTHADAECEVEPTTKATAEPDRKDEIGSAPGLVTGLERLHSLRNAGALSEEEFMVAKARLLGGDR